ncbi:MAG: oligosaccharide flippase family protein [Bacteroidales bacterium]|nr:oligosaccharide flippase family protein [Bacteroidales bacterium]
MKAFINKCLAEVKNVGEKGFFHLFTAKGLIYIVGFGSQLFVAGILEPEDIGRIKIMQVYIGLSALIGGFGFNVSLVKMASDKRSMEEISDMLHLSMLVASLSFILLYLLLYVLANTGLVSNDPVITSLFPYYALFLLPTNIQSMQVAYYQAMKDLKKMAKIQLVVKLVSVGLIIGATYLYQLEGYVAIISITGFLSVFSLKRGLLGFVKKLLKMKFNFTFLADMWRFARFALLANLAYMLLNTMDIYFINYLVEDRGDVGYYMFAITLLSGYGIFQASIQQVAFPYFSSKSESYISWWKTYKKYNQMNHLVWIVICILGIVLVPPFIRFAFSGKYDLSIGYFIYLSVGGTLMYLNMMKGIALMGYGKFNLNFYSSMAGLLISLPIVYFLIKLYGLDGAVIGKIISGALFYLAHLSIFRIFLRRRTV